MTISSTLMIRNRFQWYRCDSGICHLCVAGHYHSPIDRLPIYKRYASLVPWFTIKIMEEDAHYSY